MTTPNRLLGFWRSLSDSNQSKAAYLGRALLADLPVSYAVGLALTLITGIHAPRPSTADLPRLFLGLCVVAPIAETFGMAVIIWLLRFVLRRTEYVPWVTALIWAGLHSLSKPLWGIEIFWSFVIFSLCYMAWEKKSVLQAFWLTVILHSLHNLVPTLVLLIKQGAF